MFQNLGNKPKYLIITDLPRVEHGWPWPWRKNSRNSFWKKWTVNREKINYQMFFYVWSDSKEYWTYALKFCKKNNEHLLFGFRGINEKTMDSTRGIFCNQQYKFLTRKSLYRKKIYLSESWSSWKVQNCLLFYKKGEKEWPDSLMWEKRVFWLLEEP